jgi:hypothetical protein
MANKPEPAATAAKTAHTLHDIPVTFPRQPYGKCLCLETLSMLHCALWTLLTNYPHILLSARCSAFLHVKSKWVQAGVPTTIQLSFQTAV